ncbi:MAG: hypothetical protein WAS33_19590 [Candidatus Promineifilaceae bacterium]|jgi:hypothetical protein
MTLGNANYDSFIAVFLREVESHLALQDAGVAVSFLPIAQAGRELAQAALGQETGPI